MKIDKEYCMNSYLTVRYIHGKDKIFKEGLPHREHPSMPQEKKIPCFTAEDVYKVIRRFLPPTGHSAVFLSGGDGFGNIGIVYAKRNASIYGPLCRYRNSG